jgi:plasmid maintenance system antidote protein VapI
MWNTLYDMTDNPQNIEVFELIARDLGLDKTEKEQISYQELTDLVADRIAHMLTTSPETLFSLLYRLDVSEKKVDAVMKGSDSRPTNVALAGLIIDRQIERLRTKKEYRQDNINGWERW